MRNIKMYIPVFCFFIISCSSTKKEFDPEYVEVTNKRAQNIVNELDLNSDEKELEVRDIIAEQYRSLSRIQDGRDEKIKEIKDSEMGKEKKEIKIHKLEQKADKSIAKLHKSYIKNLSKELTEDQVVKVKDGMTYNVMPNTYNGYLDMLPNLTKDQKDTIYANLVEAREHAMDAGSSDKKHWWFGKYKGKINNYLSAEGYDLNNASKEWHKRLKERELKNSKN